MTKVLVVGGGGREAAMAWAFAQNPGTTVFCAPGNAGIAEYAQCVTIKAEDIDGLVKFAKEAAIDLTVVGPEAPLVAGIADRFDAEGLSICGPSAKAAQSEGSKSWFKELLAENDIPTASFEVYDDVELARWCVESRGAKNIVTKADGLMGGKGVTLPDTYEEAADDLKNLMSKPAGKKVVIERRLVGVERSVMAITDGTTTHMLPFTQDYKRAYDGDAGLNTGGMGAHTVLLEKSEKEALTKILHDVVAALAAKGCPFRGFIYLGVMMTEDGPMVLECNCRLGDPETQVILTSIDGDFTELCMAVAEGNLADVPAPKRTKHAVCVVSASHEYPAPSERDDIIEGIGAASEAGALVFHASTAKRSRGHITTNKGGRVLSVVGVGDTFTQARTTAYEGIKKINFPGMRYRTDIGLER